MSLTEHVKRRLRRGSLSFNLAKAVYLLATWPGRITPVLVGRVSRDYLKYGAFFSDTQLHMASLFPQETIDQVIELMRPTSVLDLGCGTGQSLDYFLSKGIDTWGVEASRLAIRHAAHSNRIVRFNLNHELRLGRRFDLIWSYEFVEHIHPKYINNLIQSFSNHADHIALSAAPPGQGGDGHYNEQPREYWIRKFAAAGYLFDAEATGRLTALCELHSANMMVFHRGTDVQ